MHLVRRTAPLALLVALVAGLLVSPLASPSLAVSDAAKTYARKAFKVTNTVRDNRDRVRLDRSKCLQRFANAQANLLAGQDISDLEPEDHQPLGPILRKCNLSLAGENLALGYAGGRKVVKQGWMKSPPHRANILERRYRQMAIAARKTESGRWVAVQVFGRKA